MKKLYKVISILLCTMMIVGMSAACNGDANASVNAEGEPVSIDPAVREAQIQEMDGVIREQSMEPLEVSEEWVKKRRKAIIVHDGKYYTVSDEVEYFDNKKKTNYNGIGADMDFGFRRLTIPINKIISIGPTPFTLYETGDECVAYNPLRESLKLFNASFYGYGISITGGERSLTLYSSLYGYSYMDRIGEWGVMDLDHNVVDDCYNLEYGKEYVVYWYDEGGNFNESPIYNAISPVYVVDRENVVYDIEGGLRSDGYTEYDLSNVAKGYYITEDGGLLRIQ